MEKTILVVDDSALARMFAIRCLQIAGQSKAIFLEAEHGQAALDVMRSTAIDLLVTDITMPVMGGVDLVKQMKEIEKLASIPIIVITSAGNQAERQALEEYGAKAVLTKPLTPPMMAEVLDRVFTK
jgi:CheY-like chemotaxis protein